MMDHILIGARGRRIESLTYGRLQIDAPRWTATWGGAKVRLPRALMLLVYHLAHRPGVVRSRNYLFEAIIINNARECRTVDSRVRDTREAFRVVDANFDQIETVYNEGYRWRAER